MASSTTGTQALSSDFFFGWDLLYKTIETTVNKKGDVLIALAHFILIKHNNFGCIGVGEDVSIGINHIDIFTIFEIEFVFCKPQKRKQFLQMKLAPSYCQRAGTMMTSIMHYAMCMTTTCICFWVTNRRIASSLTCWM